MNNNLAYHEYNTSNVFNINIKNINNFQYIADIKNLNELDDQTKLLQGYYNYAVLHIATDLYNDNTGNSILSGNYLFNDEDKLLEFCNENRELLLNNYCYLNFDANTSITRIDSDNTIADKFSCFGMSQLEYYNFDHIVDIRKGSFFGCENLNSDTGILQFSNTLQNIGAYAFYGCNSIQTVIIPSSVSSISYCAFYSCLNLQKIIFENRSINDVLQTFSNIFTTSGQYLIDKSIQLSIVNNNCEITIQTDNILQQANTIVPVAGPGVTLALKWLLKEIASTAGWKVYGLITEHVDEYSPWRYVILTIDIYMLISSWKLIVLGAAGAAVLYGAYALVKATQEEGAPPFDSDPCPFAY